MAIIRWVFRASILEATLSPTSHSPVSLSEPLQIVHRCTFHVCSSRISILSSQCSVPTFIRNILDIPCSSRSSRQFVQFCSSLGRKYSRFLIQQLNPSRMPPLREVKLLVHVSSVDCQATWLRIAPIYSQPKELISSSARRGSRTSPMVRSTM
jgi:hypothetical protein